MNPLAEVLISGLLVISGVFGLVGSFGLLKLPDLMMRLHAPTKATTVGVGAALLGSLLYFAVFHATFVAQNLLIILFLFVTAPITAQFIARVHMHTEGDGPARPPEPDT